MTSNIPQLIEIGLAHHQAGRLQEAESVYQSILKEQPQHADALHLLGVIAHQAGKSSIAVDLIENAIKTNPNVSEFYNSLGVALKVLGRQEEAMARFQRALAIKPGNAEAHNNFASTLQELGRPEEAMAHCEQALAIQPDYAAAHNNLGNALSELDRRQEAITHFEQALAIQPHLAEVHYNYGNALSELGQREAAMAHYAQAVAIKPDYALAHNNYASALQELGRPEEAIARYEQAISINPGYAEAHNNLGNALNEQGRQEEATARYGQAIAIRPDYAEAHRHLALLKPEQAQVSIIEKLLNSPTVTARNSIHYHYALGNIFEDSKSFTTAFEHYRKANTLKLNTIAYDSRNHSALVDRLIEVYSGTYLHAKTTCGSDAEIPVFIVGMPRSGTTLIEQIVSNHPQVYGAGELESMGRIESTIAKQFAASAPYPECMSLCSDSVARKYSIEYLRELDNRAPGAIRVTDKMPDNFLRIGLIKTLFPHARIVHCQRKALDTCTSIFTNYFVKGHEYSFDLSDLGHYYLDYERLMAHWHTVFSSQILQVQYEELVMNQEDISRQLIEYLGLEWDEKCLDFHRNERAVRTASNAQVRKPIYKSSINRWKHYEEQLGPLIAILHSAASR